MCRTDLRPLIRPESIAIIGATPDTGKPTGRMLGLMTRHGFPGRIYPVNPRYEEVFGLRCYSSVARLPDPPDLAVIGLQAHQVPGMLHECASAGVKSVLIASAGFAEVGGTGAFYQQQIVQIANAAGMVVLGPNCMGLVNREQCLLATFASIFDRYPLPRGPAALISQSGFFGIGMLAHSAVQKVGFDYFVSVGNEAVLEYADVAEELSRLPGLKVIAGYLETVRDVERFRRIMPAVRANGIPVAVVKSGRTAAGARATASHTGAIAGSHAAYQALFEETGVIQLETEAEVTDLVQWLSYGKKLMGPRIAIVTITGGGGALLADLLESQGLQVPQLPDETIRVVASRLRSYVSTSNPVDIAGSYLSDMSCVSHTLSQILADPSVDGAVYLGDYRSEPMVAELVAAGASSDKPLACVWLTPTEKHLDDHLIAARIPSFPDLGRCAKALKALYRASLSYSLPEAIPAVQRPEWEFPPNTLTGLAELSIPVATERDAETEADAVMAAEQIGYPVVVKVNSPDIAHRNESGGVRLGIVDAEGVRAACQAIHQSVTAFAPDSRWGGYLVSRQVQPVAELIVGATREQGFPPLILAGPGGVAAEAGGSFVYAFAPLSESQALSLTGRIGLIRYLKERRRFPLDERKLAAILRAVGDLMTNDATLKEFEINPLALLADGSWCALDALFVRSDDLGEKGA